MTQDLALTYCKALFNLDQTKECLEKRQSDFQAMQSVLKQNPKFLKFLKSPQIKIEEKEKIMQSCLSDKLDPLFFRFFMYLVEKRRLNYFKQITLEYRLMVDRYLEIWEAKILTAIPIQSDIEEKIKNKLESFYHKKIKIKKEIDPSMIGGAILLINSEMLDWSIANRLEKMKESLLKIKI